MGLPQKALDVSFRKPEDFEREYETNIGNGGIFIETRQPLAVRDRVAASLKLLFIRKGITLEGEVVHVVGEELAAPGATPGVAVQFDAAATELRELFDPVFAAIGARERGSAPQPANPKAVTTIAVGAPAAVRGCAHGSIAPAAR